MADQKILIVDDEMFIRDIVKSILEPYYNISEAADGQQALDFLKKEPPSLVILDYKMPKKTGIEVCKVIKEDSLYQHIPVIMLTGKKELQDKLEGLDSGADDYLVKPFEPEELLARVRMVLRRTERDLDANPLTRLPGNVAIREEVQKRIVQKRIFSVLYLDLDKFKVFNDYYGFERGDILIKQTAQVILDSVKDMGQEDDFGGHVGGDDFVVVTIPSKDKVIAKEVIKRFDENVASLYDEEDRKRQYIVTKDREGKKKRFSFVSISIGIVSNQERELKHIGEVSSIGAELKGYAKKWDKSVFIEERRKEE
jgi:diguanylate cyclase (GGDEF)-like protein